MNYSVSKYVLRYLVLLTILALFGCSSGGITFPPNDDDDDSISLSQTELAMIDRINDYRNSLGRGDLFASSALNRIAQEQATYMASLGNVQHVDQYGERVADRATRVGYNWLNVGENIGTASSGTQMFNEWLDSPAHRDVLEGSEYEDIGVGVSTSFGQQYWVVVVGRRM